MPRSAIPVALLAATLAAALLFGLAPDLDRAAAALFYTGADHFAGDTRLGNAVRKVFYWTPTAVLLLMLALYAARRLGRAVPWAPTGRGAVFLVLTFAVGPGLVANTILKDHSHRPRPYQTAGFGGDEPFRPFY
ncbi:MAG: hypothetical protein INR64_20490, partial [Caulobacteraceae bacterium]|nr:hypothetical protein [Caulobacter sp.]